MDAATQAGSFDLCYPHLFDKIILLASLEARLSLRLVSRNARTRVDYHFPPHVLIKYDSEDKSLAITRSDCQSAPLAAVSPQTYFRMEGHELFPDEAWTAYSASSSATVFMFLYILKRDAAATKLSMVRVLDVDLGGLIVEDAEVEELSQIMPRLQVVRYYSQLDAYAPLLPVPVVVFLTILPDAWVPGRNSHHEITSGIGKMVLNIDSYDVDDIPTFGMVERLPAEEPRGSSPKEMVFFVSFYWEPEDMLAYLATLWREITQHILKMHPWVKPILVVRQLNHAKALVAKSDIVDTDSENGPENAHFCQLNTVTPQGQAETWDPAVPQNMRELKDALVSITRELMATPTPLIDGSYNFPAPAVSTHETEAMVSRLEALTSAEYRARIGPEAFSIETETHLPDANISTFTLT